MQLDKTNIAIRERKLFEILDLSLHIIRDYAAPLTICLIVGAMPFVAINHVLIGWLLDFEIGVSFPYRYIWLSILLIAFETPLATLFVTSYLGQAVFNQRPSLSAILGEVLRAYPKVIWSNWILRGVILAMVLAYGLRSSIDFRPTVEVLFLPGILMFAMSIRACRPFINEIIVLEKTPLLRRRSEAIRHLTLRQRSRHLHNPNIGVHCSRTISITLFAIMLAVAVYSGIVAMTGIFLHDWRQGYIMMGICFPLTLWIVAGYTSIVRFLCYLDTRIRQEGWEVEILIRAEATTLKQKMF